MRNLIVPATVFMVLLSFSGAFAAAPTLDGVVTPLPHKAEAETDFTPVPTPTEEQEIWCFDPFTVGGIVRDLDTGLPIEGAAVSGYATGGLDHVEDSDITDSEGRYEMQFNACGIGTTFSVTAQITGYEDGTYLGDFFGCPPSSGGFVVDLDMIPTNPSTPTPTPDADLNGDGTVDEVDLLVFLRQWHAAQLQIPTPTITSEATPTPTPTTIPTSTQEPLPEEVTIDVPNLSGSAKPLVMVRIPAGSFEMGSNDDETWSYCYPCEQPVHLVTIENDFYIGKYEVTQAQWQALMGTNPSTGYGVGDDYPVYSVSWDACQTFIAELNALGNGTFRLPSEAEWEYACRAGSTTRFYYGDSNCPGGSCISCDLDAYAWWCGNNIPNGAKTVGQKLPNAFGLYDMHGNVWEWCQDLWHDSYTGAPNDGSAWEVGDDLNRVVRSSFWGRPASRSRSSYRSRTGQNNNPPGSGVRVVWTP